MTLSRPARSRRARSALLATLIAAAAALAPSLAPGGERPLVVASKSDTEGALTGAMIALCLEDLGVPVTRRLGLGPTLIVRAALLSGEVDVYPEYTGNGAFFTGTETDPAWRDPQAAFERIRRADAARGLAWLARAPANNTWLIAVQGALARRDGLASMADFAAAVARGAIRLAASTEFVESPAALPAFEAAYGFHLPVERIVSLPGGDTAVTARAAAQGIGGVNAGMVYGTDGAIAALDLVVMSDPKAAQIVYEVAPVFRAEALARRPEIAERLARVFAGLDAATLRRLNGRISVDGELPETVAVDHLRRSGLIGSAAR
ncbi:MULTISPECIES: glycine betaine ABC transporter substrate-binding protein [Methylobacterium]|uniref:Glycine betaine-binding protein YehZ n=1 Tax=Methylobacterium jeotgali TaxID=381630 RepID=A0ABQ4SVK7_9HYPH|nr:MULTISPECIES: glycine betaine ABC transporter substrate-binding protein [Methylobacterium]PIU05210.1 MAG: ABC transporter substrate-binding protein [Methylobacterium sp. CG09_land_8_20_14_0_10_71_15]PIU12016.1 MAG: ABC transporter substrate-binding protein [Methylobacterium sp. CG08_land_8_20_14_0_20_71_15]GBU16032.1 ABC transporter periplasmic binding protein [Methylobacterium sp.]GJE07245.1 Glycine betaine-binding protein YehZ [Methylobacterium jeotgali]